MTALLAKITNSIVRRVPPKFKGLSISAQHEPSAIAPHRIEHRFDVRIGCHITTDHGQDMTGPLHHAARLIAWEIYGELVTDLRNLERLAYDDGASQDVLSAISAAIQKCRGAT